MNYTISHIGVILYDKDIKVTWNSTARYTQRWTPTNQTEDVTFGGLIAAVGSCACDEIQLMKDGYKTDSVDYDVDIWLGSNTDIIDAEYAYIKFGMFYRIPTQFVGSN